MKNVGVPETPERSAESTSCAIRPRAGARPQVLLEPLDVEPELLGVADEIAVAERVLALEQQVVHLPERALLCRRLRRLGRPLRVRVDVVQRQVPPRRSRHRRCSRSSSRTTGSAWPQYGHSKSPYSSTVTGASTRAADVVALRVDRIGEVDDQVRRAEQHPDPLPPRQPLRREDEQPRRASQRAAPR